MTNNDALRTLRYLLNVGDGVLAQIVKLGGCDVGVADVARFLKKDDDPEYQECPHNVMAHFLNGLVIYKRGQDPARPAAPLEVPVTNNLMLKKVRVAFALKDTDIIRLIEANGLTVGKTELGAFFRHPDHRNYRQCGDQFLRYLFKGIAAQGNPLAS